MILHTLLKRAARTPPGHICYSVRLFAPISFFCWLVGSLACGLRDVWKMCKRPKDPSFVGLLARWFSLLACWFVGVWSGGFV